MLFLYFLYVALCELFLYGDTPRGGEGDLGQEEDKEEGEEGTEVHPDCPQWIWSDRYLDSMRGVTVLDLCKIISWET